MGSRGQGALQALLGSVSRDVTKYTTRPTVVVPEGSETKLRGGRAVRCGVDGSEECGRAARFAAGLAAALGSELIVLSVMDVTRVAAPAAAAIPAVPEPPDVSGDRAEALRERAHRVRLLRPDPGVVAPGCWFRDGRCLHRVF